MVEATYAPVSSQGFRAWLDSIFSQKIEIQNGYVRFSTPHIDWFIYCREGKVCYLSHSIEPAERLSRVLRSCLQGTAAENQIFLSQVQEKFEQINVSPKAGAPQADYQVLTWLAEMGQLEHQQMKQLVYKLSLEVMEVLALLASSQKDYSQQPESAAIADLEALPACDFQAIYQEAVTRLEQWKSLQPELFSPYQRPYLTGAPLTDVAPEMRAKLRQLFIGLSWRQIAVVLRQDELILAQKFLPLFRKGVIKLHDPFSPFNHLPWKLHGADSSAPKSLDALQTKAAGLKVAALKATTRNQATSRDRIATGGNSGANSIGHSVKIAPAAAVSQLEQPSAVRSVAPSIPGAEQANPASQAPVKTWKIVCIDDSPAVLNEIQRLLQTDLFEVTLINDSKKALMKINSIKPDVILLDANMPGVDGYQVCTMLRKSAILKHIPVVMVTGNRGLVNRARAKMAGVTDYLNKPFNQKDLLAMVFRYISQ